MILSRNLVVLRQIQIIWSQILVIVSQKLITLSPNIVIFGQKLIVLSQNFCIKIFDHFLLIFLIFGSKLVIAIHILLVFIQKSIVFDRKLAYIGESSFLSHFWTLLNDQTFLAIGPVSVIFFRKIDIYGDFRTKIVNSD